jgi:Putative porin
LKHSFSYFFLVLIAWFCIIFFCAPNAAIAQIRGADNAEESINRNTRNSKSKDTSGAISRKHEHIDTRVDIYFTTFAKPQKQFLDSSINLFHRDRYVGTWQHNLGNQGSVVNPLMPSFNYTAVRQLGIMPQMQAYCHTSDSAKFYNTTKPYTEFWYKAGGFLEQSGEIFHTQNFTPKNNFSFRYTKFGSPGYFLHQTTNHDHLVVTFQYMPSANQRFSTKVFASIHQLRQDENGGLLNENDLASNLYGLRSTVPVLFNNGSLSANSSAVRNYFRQNELKMMNYFTLGFKKNKDSLLGKQAGFELFHVLRIEGQKQVLKDAAPLPENYLWADTFAFKASDSIYAMHRLQTIQNEIGGQLPSVFKGKVLMNASLGFEFATIANAKTQSTLYSNYARATIQSNQQQALWQYAANAQLYLLGDAIGNYMVQANASRQIGFAQAKLLFNQSLTDAPWLTKRYTSNFYAWNNSFDKIFTTTVGASVQNDSKHYKVSASNSTIVNYVYWDANNKAKQLNGALTIFQIEAQKTIHWRHWSWMQDVLLQQGNTNAPINYAPVGLRTMIAYTNKIFKKAMLASIGIDASYNTPYRSASYQALLGQFAFDNAYTQNALPRVGVFFNSKIKRFRVYLAADELLTPLNYYYNRVLLKGYAATDFQFRAGFCWVMVN